MLRLTSTGWALLAVMAAFCTAAVTSQSGLLVLLAGLMLGCLVVNAVRAFRAVRCLEVVPPALSHTEEGGRLNEPWLVVNRGPAAVGQVAVSNSSGLLLQISCLAGREQRHVVPGVRFSRRGVHALAGTVVETHHPFGLVRARHPPETERRDRGSSGGVSCGITHGRRL